MAPDATARVATPHSDEFHTLAQVELGGTLVGIPAGCVVRALPRPAPLAQLPRAGAAIDGVFSDGGQLVPLVDLRRWMAGGSAGDVPPLVMVLDADGRSLGLAVDAVRGLVRVPAARVRQVHHDDAPDEFFHSVATLDDGVSLISLLDPLRLMSQVRVWAPSESSTGRGQIGAEHEGPAAAALFALVRIAGSLVAFDTNHVGEVVHSPSVQPLDLGGSEVAGILRLRGQQVPMLAGPGTLGLPGSATASRGGLALLLSDGSRAVALPIDAVHAVQPIDAAAIQPAHDAGLAADAFFRGVVRNSDGENVLLLDSERLLATFAAPGLSAKAAQDSAGGGSRRKDSLAQAHIVVQAGQEWAISMSSVHEITSLPDDFEMLPSAGQSVAGSAGWRGRSLPVLDLRGAAGRVDRRRTRMVVVQHGERHAALLADDLTALLPSNAATHSRFKVAGGGLVDMLTVASTGARKSYRVMDLGALPFFAGTS
jgi:chemotaxis signal transduction protein